MYLTNNNEANHRYLYGQVQVGIDNADQALEQMLRNPHVTIATVADGLLGKGNRSDGDGLPPIDRKTDRRRLRIKLTRRGKEPSVLKDFRR